MLEIEQNRLDWNFNIPKSLRYVFLVDSVVECPICKDKRIRDWSAPYIIAGVPYDDLIKILHRYFDFVATPEIIRAHKDHIRIKYMLDDKLRAEAEKQMQIIESDLTQKVDEKVVIESAIRSLYARKLKMEIERDYGKEYILTCQQLQKWVEMKLKMKNELVEEGSKISIADLIKIGGGNEGNDRTRIEVKSGKISRDGSRASIKYFVWDKIDLLRKSEKHN